ncbi:MAG: DUF4861 family protein [Lutibacter sp.]|nr:DUF4861 family protein [Lutibacter sp.]
MPNEQVHFIQVKDLKNNTFLLTQSIDYNEDGVSDEFLFQSNFNPNEKKEFELRIAKKDPLGKSTVYAAYMPNEEGMQDFTWENNFIGYRFFGQERAKLQGT